MTITYINPLPIPTNNPSQDVTNMAANNAAVLTWSGIDHIALNTAGNTGGQHLQCNFPGTTTQGSQTDPASCLYTSTGTASSIADLFFTNQNGTFRPNIIKAAGVFQGTGGGNPTVTNACLNVSSIVRTTGPTTYTVTLTGVSLTSSPPNAIIIASCSSQAAFASTIISSNTISFSSSISGFDTSAIYFAVLQV